MSYGQANCPKCGEPTNFYPEVGEDESRMLCKDCRIADLRAELDDLKSFDGIMRQIDTHYPLDVAYFRDSNDPGCVAMRAQRQCLLATQRAEKAEAEVEQLNWIFDHCHIMYETASPHGECEGCAKLLAGLSLRYGKERTP